MTRYLSLPITLLTIVVLVGGCDSGLADLDVQNTNNPTRSAALQSDEDLKNLLAGTTTQNLQATVSDWGPHMDLLADQTTSTNAVRAFWDFAEEPRLTLNNRPTYAEPRIFTHPWEHFNSGQSGANEILRVTEVNDEDIVVNGSPVTAKMRASAYFLRGVARGYLGLIYDQAYVVPATQEPLEIKPGAIPLKPYSTVIDSAVADLNRAIRIAENGMFTWDLLLGNSYSSAALAEIANSFAAKFLIGKARTRQELEDFSPSYLDRIISHAESGVGSGGDLETFTPVSTSGEFFQENAFWSAFLVSGPSGYLPVDVKVQHLLDPSYPVEYPTDPETVLDEVQTADPRIAYFSYTGAFGFLNAARNRSLFSNYYRLRTYGFNNWDDRSGDPVMMITNSEMQYIKAEAYLMKGEKGNAATALRNSPFGDVKTKLEADLPNAGALGGNSLTAGKSISSAASMAEFVRALHTEYSVELDLMATNGTIWFFMRRHDLLQKGTPLHYPVPGEELQVIQKDYYSFGGAENAGASGTATGANSWRTFDQRHGISSPVGYDSGSGTSRPSARTPDASTGVTQTSPRGKQH